MAHRGPWYIGPGGRWQCSPPEQQELQQDELNQPTRRNSMIVAMKPDIGVQQAKRSASMSAIVAVPSSPEASVGDSEKEPLNQQKFPAQAIEDSKSQCLDRVTANLREELIAECTRIAAEKVAVFQQQLEKTEASSRQTATATLKTLEELSETSLLTNMQLQAELERMNRWSETVAQKSEDLSNEVIELRSFCITRGLGSVDPQQEQGFHAFGIQDLREELRQDHVKTKKCISELVCGIEEVAQALASKEKLWSKRFDALHKEFRKLEQIVPYANPASAGRSCSSAAWPLMTVKEDDAEADQSEQPAGQPVSWEQEVAREVISMRMQLEYLQGDLTELRDITTRGGMGGRQANVTVRDAKKDVLPKPFREGDDGLQAREADTAKELKQHIRNVNGQLENDIASDGNTADISITRNTVGSEDATANSILHPDELRALCSQLQQWYDYEEQRLTSPSTSASVTKLSNELTEAKTEVAEALELVHEAVRLGEVLKREIECERKERYMDIKKLSGRLDCMDKVKHLMPLMPPQRTISGVPPIA